MQTLSIVSMNSPDAPNSFHMFTHRLRTNMNVNSFDWTPSSSAAELHCPPQIAHVAAIRCLHVLSAISPAQVRLICAEFAWVYSLHVFTLHHVFALQVCLSFVGNAVMEAIRRICAIGTVTIRYNVLQGVAVSVGHFCRRAHPSSSISRTATGAINHAMTIIRRL